MGRCVYQKGSCVRAVQLPGADPSSLCYGEHQNWSCVVLTLGNICFGLLLISRAQNAPKFGARVWITADDHAVLMECGRPVSAAW